MSAARAEILSLVGSFRAGRVESGKTCLPVILTLCRVLRPGSTLSFGFRFSTSRLAVEKLLPGRATLVGGGKIIWQPERCVPPASGSYLPGRVRCR